MIWNPRTDGSLDGYNAHGVLIATIVRVADGWRWTLIPRTDGVNAGIEPTLAKATSAAETAVEAMKRDQP
jgi:hypothetical protein